MSTSDDLTQILSSLSDAIKGDDVGSLKSLLSTKPGILDLAAQNWPENPLFLAFNSKSLRVIEEIGRRKREFAREKTRDGETVLHLACMTGDDQIVIALVRIDSLLCLEQDKSSMIPLHTAIKYGRGNLVRELISACPESLEMLTSHLETVFHVAVYNKKCDVFEILFEQAMNLGKEYILRMKDRKGNNVLHVAVSKQLFPIVKMMLPCNPNSWTGFLNRVNSLNKRGYTALDLCNMKSPSASSARIRPILLEAGAIESRSLKMSDPPKREAIWAVLSIFFAVIFTVGSALPAYSFKQKINITEPFQFEDVASGRLPVVFYMLLCLTIIITLCSCVVTVLLYKVPWGKFLLIAGFFLFILYILLAKFVMPKFLIRLGSHDISSYQLMWILAMSNDFALLLILLVGMCSLWGFNRFAEWLQL